MFKLIKPAALTVLIAILCSCGSKNTSGPNPEDTVLVNTSEIRPDWIEELDISEQEIVLEELEEAGLEPRDTVLVDPNVWGDPNAPKITVFFDLDNFVVRPADYAVIEQAAQTLIEKTDLQVLLTGFCDWRGTTDYNLALGEKRANSVKDYFVQFGVDAERIDILSRGDLDAVVEASPSQMAEERRVEIVIVQ
ncbi:MAG: OmpA family protein [Opitutales bacterium]|nr:OmpA family protein [Opitutales bacterium]